MFEILMIFQRSILQLSCNKVHHDPHSKDMEVLYDKTEKYHIFAITTPFPIQFSEHHKIVPSKRTLSTNQTTQVTNYKTLIFFVQLAKAHDDVITGK